LARAFQNRSLVPELTVLENVALGCYTSVRWSAARDLVGPWLTRRMRRRETALAQDALDAVSFPVDRRQVPAWELSLGEQKLVDIARALAGRAEVLVLDEPTAGLNHDEMDALGEVLQELRNRSAVTVVLVAHHVAFVSRVADAVTVLDGGRCIASGPPQSVFTDPEVVVAFLGEEIVSDVAPDGRQP
jgi:branched-chain amino acid transport system permease protein